MGASIDATVRRPVLSRRDAADVTSGVPTLASDVPSVVTTHVTPVTRALALLSVRLAMADECCIGHALLRLLTAGGERLASTAS